MMYEYLLLSNPWLLIKTALKWFKYNIDWANIIPPINRQFIQSIFNKVITWNWFSTKVSIVVKDAGTSVVKVLKPNNHVVKGNHITERFKRKGTERFVETVGLTKCILWKQRLHTISRDKSWLEWLENEGFALGSRTAALFLTCYIEIEETLTTWLDLLLSIWASDIPIWIAPILKYIFASDSLVIYHSLIIHISRCTCINLYHQLYCIYQLALLKFSLEPQ